MIPSSDIHFVIDQITSELQKLTNHKYITLVTRGNAAIDLALSIIPKNKTILIPEEGGWLHYWIAPKKQKLAVQEVKCNDAKLDLLDLKQKLSSFECGALLYQNPGGYFAEQPAAEIYALCQKYHCLVIQDVSGSIGTKLCDGKDANLLLSSFGEEKLINAGVGGFLSCNNSQLSQKIEIQFQQQGKFLTKVEDFQNILQKLKELPQRINFLENKRKVILQDFLKKPELKSLPVVHPQNLGFVVVVKYFNDVEKEKIIKYCQDNQLEWTQCPRYLRLNQNAISIELKRL